MCFGKDWVNPSWAADIIRIQVELRAAPEQIGTHRAKLQEWLDELLGRDGVHKKGVVQGSVQGCGNWLSVLMGLGTVVMCKQLYWSWDSTFISGIHLEESSVAVGKAQTRKALPQVQSVLYFLEVLW